LPFPFWRVSIGRRRSPRSGESEVRRGDLWAGPGEPLTRVPPGVPPQSAQGDAAPIEWPTVDHVSMYCTYVREDFDALSEKGSYSDYLSHRDLLSVTS
jgi:hypothetical protein